MVKRITYNKNRIQCLYKISNSSVLREFKRFVKRRTYFVSDVV